MDTAISKPNNWNQEKIEKYNFQNFNIISNIEIIVYYKKKAIIEYNLKIHFVIGNSKSVVEYYSNQIKQNSFRKNN